jgi:prepilin-type N-terminal cleavage/methylation domain-containing protein
MGTFDRLLEEERGFSLLELLIVMITLGILLSIAAPSYMSFKDRGRKATASANIRQAVQALGMYANDNFKSATTSNDPDWNGTDAAGTGTNGDNGWHMGYSGQTMVSRLKAKYNAGLPTSYTWNPAGFSPSPDDTTDYCIYITNGAWYAAARGSTGVTSIGKTMTLSSCTAS